MSRFLYNGIELPYVHTRQINYAAIYNDLDSMEYLYTEVTIEIEAVLSSDFYAASSPARQMAAIYHDLMQPRKPLLFVVGPDTMIESPAVGALVDLKNGPFPRECVIKQIGGSKTFMISYRIQTYIDQCDAGGTPPNFISNRWRSTQTINENFYSTWSTSGKIICRADMGINPDSLRGIVAPPIPPGFKRVNSEYTLQEDGLALAYSFQDQEVFLQAPAPATKASGEYSESFMKQSQRSCECRVKLEAPKVATKSDLVALAILICLTRIGGQNRTLRGKLNPTGNTILFAGVIRESIWENSVEVTIQANINQVPFKTQNISGDLSRFGGEVPGSPVGAPPPDPGTRGTAALQLIASIMHDPCLANYVSRLVATGGYTANLTSAGPPEAYPGVSVIHTVDDPPGGFKMSTDDGVYGHYTMETHYQTNNHILSLPVSSSSGAQVKGPAMVQVAGPTVSLVADYDVDRAGNMPMIPAAIQDPNAVIMHSTVQPLAQECGADGSPIYAIKGRQIYSFRDVTKVPVTHPRPPYIDDSVPVQYTGANLQSGIIDSAGNAGTGYQSVLNEGGYTSTLQGQ
jgi:hypothetical protein